MNPAACDQSKMLAAQTLPSHLGVASLKDCLRKVARLYAGHDAGVMSRLVSRSAYRNVCLGGTLWHREAGSALNHPGAIGAR